MRSGKTRNIENHNHFDGEYHKQMIATFRCWTKHILMLNHYQINGDRLLLKSTQFLVSVSLYLVSFVCRVDQIQTTAAHLDPLILGIDLASARERGREIDCEIIKKD